MRAKIITQFLMVLSFMLGAFVGHSEAFASQDIYVRYVGACDISISQLRRAKQKAQEALLDDDFVKAVSEMQLGLEKVALATSGFDQNSITQRLAELQLDVLAALKARGVSDQTVVDYLSGVIDVLVNEAQKFDRAVYIPYHYRGQSSVRDLELAYANMAIKQTDFINKSFAVKTSSGEVFPKGKGEVYLSVVQVAVRFFIDELSQNLYGGTKACTLNDMEYLLQDINDYLNNKNSKRRKYQVGMTYERVVDATQQLSVCQVGIAERKGGQW